MNTNTNVLEPLSSAATKLGISHQTLRQLVEAGQVPGYRIGKKFLVNPAEVLRSTAVPTPLQATEQA